MGGLGNHNAAQISLIIGEPFQISIDIEMLHFEDHPVQLTIIKYL